MFIQATRIGHDAAGMAQGMAIRVVEFSSGGIKLERCLPKNQHT